MRDDSESVMPEMPTRKREQPDLSAVVDGAWALYARAAASGPGIVVSPGMPVLFFGDLGAYLDSPRRVVTVALNPSDKEFPSDQPWLRFPGARDLAWQGSFDATARERYVEALSSYFVTAPYTSWFNGSFERVLWGLDASYYPGRPSVALHTDIASPVPTRPTWSRLGHAERAVVRDDGAALWRALVRALRPDVVILSAAREHVSSVTAVPLETWAVIAVVEQSLPLSVQAISTTVGDADALVVFARSAQVPFGTISYDERERIGGAIAAHLGGRPLPAAAVAPAVAPSRRRRTRNVLPPVATFASFDVFMRECIEPLRAEHPSWRRLDGASSGGNRGVVATFRHDGEVWKVHADTHFEPLEIARRATRAEPGSDPFVVEHARAGRCLALREDLRRQYASRHKHLYIYEL